MKSWKIFQQSSKMLMYCCFVCVTLLVNGCANHRIARPEFLVPPEPIMSNSGEYLSSYTQDGVLSEWTDKMANVGLGATIGGAVGAAAANYALQQIPFVGGIIGNYAGKAIGRKIAIESVGGMDFIKSKSDVSFNNPSDLAIYMYAKYCHTEHYFSAVGAQAKLYPDAFEKGRFEQYLIAASADVCSKRECPSFSEYRELCGKPRPEPPPVQSAQAPVPADAMKAGNEVVQVSSASGEKAAAPVKDVEKAKKTKSGKIKTRKTPVKKQADITTAQ